MKWYSKYLPVYEKPFAEVPAETVAEVRAKLAERQSDRPLATVSVIACNEEKRLTACLWSLAEQRCRYPMEIIATDNLSKDRTAEIFETLGLPWQRETNARMRPCTPLRTEPRPGKIPHQHRRRHHIPAALRRNDGRRAGTPGRRGGPVRCGATFPTQPTPPPDFGSTNWPATRTCGSSRSNVPN